MGLLEPSKTLDTKNKKDKEEVQIPVPIQQQPKEFEILGIPYSQLKDGLVIGSIAFTAIIGAKVFLVDPYIAMVQRQNEQATLEKQQAQQALQQAQQPQPQKHFQVIDNNIRNLPMHSRLGALDIQTIDNTDTSRNTVMSNDVRPKPTLEELGYKIVDNTAASNPYSQNRFVAPTQAQSQIIQPRSTNQRPLATGTNQWPSTKSWPASSVAAVEPRNGTSPEDEEVDTGVAAISAALPQGQQPQTQTQVQGQQKTQPKPSVLEQQIAGDADSYYYFPQP